MEAGIGRGGIAIPIGNDRLAQRDSPPRPLLWSASRQAAKGAIANYTWYKNASCSLTARPASEAKTRALFVRAGIRQPGGLQDPLFFFTLTMLFFILIQPTVESPRNY